MERVGYDRERTGLRLATLRREHGWNVSDLSQRAGIAESDLEGFENASREMALEDAYEISKALGVSLEDLIWRVGEVRSVERTPS